MWRSAAASRRRLFAGEVMARSAIDTAQRTCRLCGGPIESLPIDSQPGADGLTSVVSYCACWRADPEGFDAFIQGAD